MELSVILQASTMRTLSFVYWFVQPCALATCLMMAVAQPLVGLFVFARCREHSLHLTAIEIDLWSLVLDEGFGFSSSHSHVTVQIHHHCCCTSATASFTVTYSHQSVAAAAAAAAA
jgi:hypothetical protein